MKIVSYVDLSKAQEAILDNFQNIIVRTALVKPFVVATIRTFQNQEVKITINDSGTIEHVEVIG